jgi:hypothetical protein
MATPRRQAVRAAATAASSLWTGALRFEAHEENSGRHRWRLSTRDGCDVPTSCAGVATHDQAQRAAGENRH